MLQIFDLPPALARRLTLGIRIPCFTTQAGQTGSGCAVCCTASTIWQPAARQKLRLRRRRRRRGQKSQAGIHRQQMAAAAAMAAAMAAPWRRRGPVAQPGRWGRGLAAGGARRQPPSSDSRGSSWSRGRSSCTCSPTPFAASTPTACLPSLYGTPPPMPGGCVAVPGAAGCSVGGAVAAGCGCGCCGGCSVAALFVSVCAPRPAE